MSMLHRVWEDVRKGENVDLYVVVLMAILFTTLGITGVGNERIISSVNVAVLGLLAIAMLQTRRTLEGIQTSSAFASTRIRDEFPKEFPQHIEAAKEVVLVGVHHASIMNDHYGAFERMIRNGGVLKVLQSAPDGHACGMAALRFAGSVDDDQERIRARSSLKVLTELQRIDPKCVTIKTFDYLFEYGACLINPSDWNAILYVQRYTFKIYGGARKPKLVYQRADGQWFHLYHSEIFSFWGIAK